jgi:hypothetical protein
MTRKKTCLVWNNSTSRDKSCPRAFVAVAALPQRMIDMGNYFIPAAPTVRVELYQGTNRYENEMRANEMTIEEARKLRDALSKAIRFASK